jgi:hypothetical protein
VARRLWFILAIILGVSLGLAYGWVINPVKYVNTSPDSMREDYKTDYVLMVAEVYHSDGDIAGAARRLAFLGNTPPLELVQQAIVFAGQAGYTAGDIDLMIRLNQTLQVWTPESPVTQ